MSPWNYGINAEITERINDKYYLATFEDPSNIAWLGEPVDDYHAISAGTTRALARTDDTRPNIKGPSSNVLFLDLHVSSSNWSILSDDTNGPRVKYP